MTKRTFIFCDHCNPEGIRQPDRRFRNQIRESISHGRRQSDDRSWCEIDDLNDAANWVTLPNGQHICPRCKMILND